MKTYKTKLKLNNKQKTLFFKNASVARFAYNLTLGIEQENYKEGNKFLSDCGVRKLITQRKKDKEDLYWLSNFDCDIVKQAVKDACRAYKRFFDKKGNYPKFKSRKRTRPSFYVDGWKLKIENGYIKIPRCSKVKLYEKDYIPEGLNYQNPRITFDGINWWISVGLKEEQPKPQLTDETVGVDLGVKYLATCSTGKVYLNPTKQKNYRKVRKSLKQKQRQMARKFLENKRGEQFRKTKNILKLEKVIRKKQIKLNDIKLDFFHKASTDLVRTKPNVIILEDLYVKGMLKNKNRAESLHRSSMSMFKTILVNKAESAGITIVEADRFFPSSQLCSICGFKHVAMKDNRPVFDCPNCGHKMDRDLNASINLKNYPEFQGKLSLRRATQTQVSSNRERGFDEEGILQKVI